MILVGNDTHKRTSDMYNPTLVLTALALTTLGWQPRPDSPLRLKDARLTLEYAPDADRASVIVETECETALQRIEVRDLAGESVLSLQARAGSTFAAPFAVQGLAMQGREMTAASLFRDLAEGIYEIHAWTVDGQPVLGSASFSHVLPRAPVMIFPLQGAVDVPTTSLNVSWIADPQAAGYRLALERGERHTLSVELPPGAGSFQIPDGVLIPGTRYRLEIGRIAHNGNRTIVEVPFMTRP